MSIKQTDTVRTLVGAIGTSCGFAGAVSLAFCVLAVLGVPLGERADEVRGKVMSFKAAMTEGVDTAAAMPVVAEPVQLVSIDSAPVRTLAPMPAHAAMPDVAQAAAPAAMPDVVHAAAPAAAVMIASAASIPDAAGDDFGLASAAPRYTLAATSIEAPEPASLPDIPPPRPAPPDASALVAALAPDAQATPESSASATPAIPMPLPAPDRPPLPPTPAEQLGLNAKERAKAERCLAEAVYFEARSEPYRGQVSVAQVVMNRVFSPYYPNDVCGVVYQNAHRRLSCQFTFACDGIPERVTDRGSWTRAKRIAKATLDGKIWDPAVAKSTHYHAAYVRPNWVREMKKMRRYGLHTFYRPHRWGDGSQERNWSLVATQASFQARIVRQ